MASLRPRSFSPNLPPIGLLGLAGPMVLLCGICRTGRAGLLPAAPSRPKFSTTHWRSCMAISRPTPSPLASISAAISASILASRCFPHRVWSTPRRPAAALALLSSAGKMAGIGFVWRTREPGADVLRMVMSGGTEAPGGRR